MGRKHRKPREKRGLRIEVRNNNVEFALKKFKRMVKDSGMMLQLKKKMKVGGKVVSIVQIKVTGKDKFTIAYLDWDNGKRPLLTRKILKNVSAKNLPKELKRTVKVG